MFISPGSGTGWLEAPKMALCLKYYNVLKWENRTTLGLNATKITDYNKKRFK